MFSLDSEEHRMIRDAVRKVLANLRASDEERRQRNKTRIDSRAVGDALAELGLFGGASPDATMTSARVQAIVATEAGAVALPFPVTEVLATTAAMAAGGTSNDDAAVRVMSSRIDDAAELPVLRDGRLQGLVHLVPFSRYANRMLVEARGEGGTTLVDVDLADARIVRAPRACVETDYAMDDLRFEDVPAIQLRADDKLGDKSAAAMLRRRVTLLAAAETAGACRHMVAMTREYLLMRSQFGKPLGSNQVLKHKLAENHVKVEALLAAIDYAAAASDAGDVEAEASIYAAKQFAGRAGKAVADSTIQMHGAIGYTVEFPLHLYMRRVHRLSASYGTGSSLADKVFELFVGNQAEALSV